MKVAFAKMMEKNPTQSSQVAFRAGGNGVPILTRASGQTTSGYQTMGLPGGSMPSPGGGANKTSLGAIRMGDQDGNGPGSAIFSNDIFYPPGQPGREYPERTFANVGNNVYQPEEDSKATLALLRRLGDQKFKAVSQAPFEDYRAQQRLARDLEEASRNASLSDLGTSREIIRNLAAERRQQNEDDYLRKILDAGGSPESARKEIEDVRNANALQEAKKVDDREYQAKTLIQRMAMARGVTPMVKEHLSQSSSIDNPQRSQAMSQAMGMSGDGFGTSPLDMNRQFMTPDFYRKFLRRSTLTQEAGDEATAFSNLITGAGNEDQLTNMQNGFSMATLKGQERQNQIEIASEALASRLDAIRQRQFRIKSPLLETAVGEEILDKLYKQKTKRPGNKVLFSPETIQELLPLQLLLSINNSAQIRTRGYERLVSEAKKYTWTTASGISTNLLRDLRKVAYAMNDSEQTVRIPFASASLSDVTPTMYAQLFQNIKNEGIPGLRGAIDRGRKKYIVFSTEDGGDLGPVEAEVLDADGPVVASPYTAVTSAATKIQALIRGRLARRARPRAPVGGALGPEEVAMFPSSASAAAAAAAAAIPSRTALAKLSADDVATLMLSLGYPLQGGKKKNIEYINARR